MYVFRNFTLILPKAFEYIRSHLEPFGLTKVTVVHCSLVTLFSRRNSLNGDLRTKKVVHHQGWSYLWPISPTIYFWEFIYRFRFGCQSAVIKITTFLVYFFLNSRLTIEFLFSEWLFAEKNGCEYGCKYDYRFTL